MEITKLIYIENREMRLPHETFYQQCSDYFQLISRKEAKRMKEYEGLLTSKLKNKEKRRNAQPKV